MKWISVDDELPEIKPRGPTGIPMSDDVLVTDGNVIMVSRCYGKGKWPGGYYEIGDFITHWMPLPALPQSPP